MTMNSVGMNAITFGKYKGMPVTRILRIDPSYFGWCKNNVRGFRFSKRDYEIYLEWLSLQQNHLQFTGYSNDMDNIRFLFRKVEEGKFNAFSDSEYLTKETCGEYLKSDKEFETKFMQLLSETKQRLQKEFDEL